jgi:hypothetical protein
MQLPIYQEKTNTGKRINASPVPTTTPEVVLIKHGIHFDPLTEALTGALDTRCPELKIKVQ